MRLVAAPTQSLIYTNIRYQRTPNACPRGYFLANIGGCERLGCWERWLLSKKTGGLITGACGLGGPQYGEEQTARRISEISAYTLNSQTAYHARWYVPRSIGCLLFDLTSWLGCLCND